MSYVYKDQENRNHVKSSLITEFVYELNSLINIKDDEGDSHETPHKRRNTQCYAPSTLTMSPTYALGTKVEDDHIPCLNPKCRWLQFQHYFYAHKIGYWLLPASDEDTLHCEICRRLNAGECKFSDIRITKNSEVCIRGTTI